MIRSMTGYGSAAFEVEGAGFEVEVRSAHALSDEEVERLRQRLGALTGKDVRIRNVVAPEIIGGVVARIGDLVMDGSVARRLQRLKESLRGTRLENVG
nr:hypothetical protein [Bacillota bacterium]